MIANVPTHGHHSSVNLVSDHPLFGRSSLWSVALFWSLLMARGVVMGCS